MALNCPGELLWVLDHLPGGGGEECRHLRLYLHFPSRRPGRSLLSRELRAHYVFPGSRAVADLKPPKRTLSADGIDGIQRPAKDFRATFQTYKKMYMEKRSRSLGSSPLK